MRWAGKWTLDGFLIATIAKKGSLVALHVHVGDADTALALLLH